MKKEKILMYRWEGDTEWKEFKEDLPTMGIKDYKVGKIYTVEYKVIEREV